MIVPELPRLIYPELRFTSTQWESIERLQEVLPCMYSQEKDYLRTKNMQSHPTSSSSQLNPKLRFTSTQWESIEHLQKVLPCMYSQEKDYLRTKNIRSHLISSGAVHGHKLPTPAPTSTAQQQPEKFNLIKACVSNMVRTLSATNPKNIDNQWQVTRLREILPYMYSHKKDRLPIKHTGSLRTPFRLISRHKSPAPSVVSHNQEMRIWRDTNTGRNNFRSAAL
jgi:hypothetical protein